MKLHFLPVILFQKQFLKNSCAFLNSERPALLPVQLNKLVYFWARRYEAATAFKEVRISQKHTAFRLALLIQLISQVGKQTASAEINPPTKQRAAYSAYWVKFTLQVLLAPVDT